MTEARGPKTIAAANGIRTLAFPSISTGIYGYPIALAAAVAVLAVRSSLQKFGPLQAVSFCCFSLADLRVYQGLMEPVRF